MGPLVLTDMVGLDVLSHIDHEMSRAFPHHGELSQIALRLVAQGHLGQKTGSGVYRYEKGGYDPLDSQISRRDSGGGFRRVNLCER